MRLSKNPVIAFLLLLGAFVLYAGCDAGNGRERLDFTERVSDEELREMPGGGADAEAFLFGFDPRSSPKEDAEQYLPFLRYLEEATGYGFALRFTPGDAAVADQLGPGRVHFAAIGAVSYIRAHERYGVVPLARGLNSEGKAEYQSVIVVRPESHIRSLEDLRGRRFAFGNADSTQGHLIPRIVLARHGIGLDALAAYTYSGSHQECANAVLSGSYDACGMQDTMGRELAGQGLVRILHESGPFPSSGIAASRRLPPAVLDAVRRALLDFEPRGRHAGGLYNWERTEMPAGFAGAREGDYAHLRAWMINLELLAPGGHEEGP